MNISENIELENEDAVVMGAMYVLSDNDSDEEISEKLSNMHNFADKNNIIIVEKYIDKNNDGKELARLLTEVQDKTLKLDVLLVTNITSVVVNNVNANADVVYKLNKLGIEIIGTI